MIIILKIITIGVITGVLSGISSTFFLNSLFYVTSIREGNSFLIFLLPLFGLLSAHVIKVMPHKMDVTISTIKSQLTEDNRLISLSATPYIFIASIGTHIFGGSAGREGVGVIMGASLSSALKKFLVIDKVNINMILLKCGMAAGFSSIFGAPIAAILFSYEINKFNDYKNKILFIAVCSASLSAYFVTKLLGLKHELPEIHYTFSYEVIYYILVSGVVCGLGALTYYFAIKDYKKYIELFIGNIYIRFFVGSLFITILIFSLSAFQYSGIGTSFINDSFVRQRSFYDFVIKFILTVLTLGVGFKGGEVTPLLFMGSSLSNFTLSSLGFSNYAMSSALGMFAFYGAATATPFTSVLMAYDLFGYQLAVIALPTCLIARFLMYKKSLY